MGIGDVMARHVVVVGGGITGLTAAFYALNYVGLAAPCVLSLAVHVAATHRPLLWSRAGLHSAPPRWWPVLRRRDRAV